MAIDTVNSLITLAEAKTWAQVTSTEYDSVLENLIDGVSWRFNKYTGRDLKARDRTDYYDGDGTDVLYVDNFPINSISTIYNDSDLEYGADTEVTEYIYYSTTGMIILEDDNFYDYNQAVKIVYNAGYSVIPYDLKKACKDQVKYEFYQWKNNQEGVTSVSLGGETVTKQEIDGMLPQVVKVLDLYKRIDHGTAHA